MKWLILLGILVFLVALPLAIAHPFSVQYAHTVVSPSYFQPAPTWYSYGSFVRPITYPVSYYSTPSYYPSAYSVGQFYVTTRQFKAWTPRFWRNVEIEYDDDEIEIEWDD